MSNEIYRNATDAWSSFRKIGGLDLDDRDEDLEVEILAGLRQPRAKTLDAALESASVDDLVRALFGATMPFMEMFRAILEFFIAAAATEGREQWSIKIDDEHLGLETFEKLVAAADAAPVRYEVPDIDEHVPWRIREILIGSVGHIERPGVGVTGDAQIDGWLEAYRAGAFPDLPQALSGAALPRGLDDARRILVARLAIARDLVGDRRGLLQEDWRGRYEHGAWGGDPYHPRQAAQDETDYWAESTVKGLHRAMQLGGHQLTALDDQLQELFGAGRRKLGHLATADQLERILSLPVWQKRHELYAVWVATEVVRGLGDHEVQLAHDGGQITFAFKETEIARIVTASPERRLISERRVALAEPIGEGRSAAVQPDYGIWSGQSPHERCHLVIEVKHYKRSRKKPFSEALQDYARAHPSARVVLVNYGPVGDVFSGNFDPRLRPRCETIRHLKPRSPDGLKQLADVVRAAVGAPFRKVRAAPGATGQEAVLLIDVSGSMLRDLRPQALQRLADQAQEIGVVRVVLVDEQVVDTIDLDALRHLDLARMPGRGTALREAASDILAEGAVLLALTDVGGLVQLRAFSSGVKDLGRLGSAYLVEVEP